MKATSDSIVSETVLDGTSRGPKSAKWFVTIDDRRVSVPDRVVRIAVIRAQAAIPEDLVLVRDHNSPDDDVLDDHGEIDCSVGNVLYTDSRCSARPPSHCGTPAKIAFSVDDRVEETMNRNQTGLTLLDLFALNRKLALYRDYSSGGDVLIKSNDLLAFPDGPVFYTRKEVDTAGLKITVNHRMFSEDQGVKPVMTAKEIAGLITNTPDDFDTYAGPEAKGHPLPPADPIKIKNCDQFTVVKREVVGGFLASRVVSELAVLKEGGASADLVDNLVIYRSVPAREGLGMSSSDVLVQVPSGYPGNHIDGAYLPAGSPFINRVVGQVSGPSLQADGRTWHLISYHPHTGGGFAPWNPNLHGFHTYIDALIAWLARWK